LEWIGWHENLVVRSPSGTGKTFLLEALDEAGVEPGRDNACAPTLIAVDDIELLPVGFDAAEELYRRSTPPASAGPSRSAPTSTDGLDELMPNGSLAPTPSTSSCTLQALVSHITYAYG
jgi:hypothetical protein